MAQVAKPKSARRRPLWRSRLMATLVVVVTVGAGWLANRDHIAWDWTSGARNTLTADSRKLLDSMHGAVQVTAYVADDARLHRDIAALLQRYHRYKADLVLRFVDPKTAPEQAHALNIPASGALVIEYQGRREKLQVLNEQKLTNALLRLAGGGDRWVAFLSGHGERSPFRKANYDVSLFAKELRERGIHVQSLDLGKAPAIPDNTSVLVIAAPQSPPSRAEVTAIQAYVRNGGDLLWLAEPGAQKGLEALADELGVQFLPGVVLSTRSRLLGLRNPAFIVIEHYADDDPVTRGLQQRSVLPVCVGLEAVPHSGWQTSAFIRSGADSWSESGDLNQPPVRFDAGSGDRRGPLDLGLRLWRASPATQGQQQRVIVAGDGDFLSNAFLANGANLQLGLNMIHWLAHDDRFIAIKPSASTDLHLQLSTAAAAFIAFGFPLGVPLLLTLGGTVLLWRRRVRAAG